jgi:hypothetical protein
MGSLYPFGGAIVPGQEDPVLLVQEQGTLCDLLLTLSETEWAAVSRLDYPAVLQQAEAGSDNLLLLDYRQFACDLLNGCLSADSFRFLDPVSVFVEHIPPGYWVGERERDGAFWALFGNEGVGLLLEDGYHRFLDREDGLVLDVFVDMFEGSWFTGIRKAPVW